MHTQCIAIKYSIYLLLLDMLQNLCRFQPRGLWFGSIYLLAGIPTSMTDSLWTEIPLNKQINYTSFGLTVIVYTEVIVVLKFCDIINIQGFNFCGVKLCIYLTTTNLMCVYPQQCYCVRWKHIPYNRKLVRQKTFANFMFCWPFANFF